MKHKLEVFVFGLLIVLFSLAIFSEARAEDAIVDKMMEEGPTVVVCNSFALGYADGIYRYGEGYNTIDEVPPHPELSDPRDIALFRDLQNSGMTTVKELVMYWEAQAEETGVPAPHRGVLMEMAKSVYGELAQACAAARSMVPIEALPNLGELTVNFIEVMKNNYGRKL